MVFIRPFLFYCLLLNHSFPTNPIRSTNCLKLILFYCNFTNYIAPASRRFRSGSIGRHGSIGTAAKSSAPQHRPRLHLQSSRHDSFGFVLFYVQKENKRRQKKEKETYRHTWFNHTNEILRTLALANLSLLPTSTFSVAARPFHDHQIVTPTLPRHVDMVTTIWKLYT